ncbi:hypothetical protein FRB90_008851 [Tulasnella sp. 427]|nr:hypothetical protein FRB90_008851 [Tulasnella sp. 427]
MAGEFAKAINANRLILNHFSARFPPAEGLNSNNNRNSRQWGRSADNDTVRMIREIERQATAGWQETSDSSKWASAVAAWDFLSVEIREHDAKDNMNADISDLRDQRKA